MKNVIIVKETDNEIFKKLYDNWAMTWEGLCKEDWNIARETVGTTPDVDIYAITGDVMNKHYNLTGINRYPAELNIVAILDYKGLAMQYGARWFTDIVDNNARREAR